MRGRVVPAEAWRPDVWHSGGPKSSRAGGGVAARGAVGSGQQATALSPTRSSCRVQLLLAAHHGHPPDPAVLRGAALLHFHVGDVRDPGALHLHGRDGKWVAGPHLRAWAGPGQVLLGALLAGRTWEPQARPRPAGMLGLRAHPGLPSVWLARQVTAGTGPAALGRGTLGHKSFRPPSMVLCDCCPVSGTLLGTRTPFPSGATGLQTKWWTKGALTRMAQAGSVSQRRRFLD